MLNFSASTSAADCGRFPVAGQLAFDLIGHCFIGDISNPVPLCYGSSVPILLRVQSLNFR